MVHVWRSEDNLQKSILSSHPLGTELWSAGLAAATCTCGAVSLAQKYFLHVRLLYGPWVRFCDSLRIG